MTLKNTVINNGHKETIVIKNNGYGETIFIKKYLFCLFLFNVTINLIQNLLFFKNLMLNYSYFCE